MTDIVAELRADIKRILARNFGLPNELAAIRVSTVARIDAYVTHAEDRAAACTCQPVKGFEIDTRRDKPLHAMFLARRLERMRVEEAGA
jgi:hypothetical protein